MEYTAKQIAQILDGTVEGNPDVKVKGFARIEHGRPGTLCFFANPKYEEYVYTTLCDVLLVNADFIPKRSVHPTLVRVRNSYEAVAAMLEYENARKRSYRRYRGLACRICSSSKIGRKVYVGDFSYIGRKTVIGRETKIYEQVYVGDNVKIGSRCVLYPGVRIYSGMVIGDNVILHSGVVIGSDGFGFAPTSDGSYRKINHTGNVIIGNDVEIGANTTVDKSQIGSTIIHDGVKIDNLCQIAHNVEIGENTVLAAQCGIAGSTKIGKNCMFGGQTGIAGHIEVADGTRSTAQAGIAASVKEPGQILMGSPAIPHGNYLRSYALFRSAPNKKSGSDK